MLKKLLVALLFVGFALYLAAPPALAQGLVKLRFTMPEDADPVDLFFSRIGDSRSFVGDDVLPGSPFEGRGGVNFKADPGFLSLRVPAFLITTDWTGSIDVDTDVSTLFPGVVPWKVTSLGPRAVLMSANLGSKDVGEFLDTSRRFFGIFRLRPGDGSIDDGDVSAFRRANFQVTAVPEPGALTLVGSLVVAGGLMGLRRLRRRAA